MARRTSPYPPLSVKSYSHHAPNDFGLTQFDHEELGVTSARRVTTTTGGVNGRKRKSFGKTTEQKKELNEINDELLEFTKNRKFRSEKDIEYFKNIDKKWFD